ncbi:Outer membrane protein assembly factor BamB [Candidatus Methanoperedenaceae archaeon GB50]|nr:Outer membrane protein assembly factor BamB [Candidatus Methanoperedenaceae archaeon GB50]CAD7773163.1 MAG: Outer membrane protein assembly factor BamB [Candidatus Methanoperedenaceae archaeon GB50]
MHTWQTALMFLVLVLLSGTAAAADWPMFGHDPQRTGVAGESVEPPLGLLWKYEADHEFGASPATSGDTVYIGSLAYFYALDAYTGTEKWKYEIDTGASSPVISGGIVYVGSSDGYVYALDATTGIEKWKYETGNEVESSPIVSEGTVYVGSSDGYVYALDATTGIEKWKYKTGSCVSSSPAVSEGTVYIGSYDNYVYALDAVTGTEKWRYKTGDRVELSSPAVSDGIVYIGSQDNYIYALDVSTGTERWKYKTGGWVLSSPAVSDDTVYIGSYDNYVYALDAITGTEKWKYKTSSAIISSPAISEGTVYIGSTEGYVYALDAATGTEKWKYKMDGCAISSPAISGGILYICTMDDEDSPKSYVYAFSSSIGSIHIVSHPFDATIYLDDTYKGTTPKTLISVSPGSHTIKLTKSGYEDYTTTVYVLAGDTESIDATLTQKTGSFSIHSSPSGADVYFDGTYHGTTPTTISNASPGSHALKLEKYGYKEWLTSVYVTSGVTESITAQLTPADISPPAISIQSPIIIDQNNNGLLEEGEKVTITYGASDPSGVASIKILLDEALLESRNQAGMYTVTTNSLSVGKHTIRVEATDSRSNSGFEELPITVERTGPSVYFGTTRTTIKKGEDAIFTLSAVNPIGNPPMTVQLILKPPSGVSVTSSSFAKAGSGIYTCTQVIESGDNVRSIEVHLTGNQIGIHEIESEVYYQFTGSPKSPTRYETLTLIVEQEPPVAASEPEDQDNGIPGFEAMFAAAGLLAAMYLLSRE